MIVCCDIYNKAARLERDLRGGLSTNRAFIEKMNALKEKGEIVFEYTVDPDTHRLQKVFMADMRYTPKLAILLAKTLLILLISSSITYLNENPYILLLDYTYNTNK